MQRLQTAREEWVLERKKKIDERIWVRSYSAPVGGVMGGAQQRE